MKKVTLKHLFFSVFTLFSLISLSACDTIAEIGSPTANAGTNLTVEFGQEVELDGSLSNDPDGTGLTYNWAFTSRPAGSAATLSDAATSYPTFTPDTEGAYEISLTVSNGDQDDTDNVTVTVVTPSSITLSDRIEADLTLRSDIPYFVDGIIYIEAALTIPAGTQISFMSDAGFSVESEGTLKSQGTATNPVVMKGVTETAGYWRGVAFYSADNQNELTYTNISHAGGSRFTFIGTGGEAAVVIDNDAILNMQNTTISFSGKYGFYADPSAIIATFSNNHFDNNVGAAVGLYATAVDKLDANSVYSDANGRNEIDIFDEQLDVDATWITPADGTPYFIAENLDIRADLVISAGASFKLASGAYISVETEGSFNAVGTASAPIKFEGESATTGFWQGIAFYSNNTANVLDYVTVSHAGSDRATFINSGGEAGIALDGGASVSITNSTISANNKHGLYLDDSATLRAFSGNTFSGNTGTAVSIPATEAHMLDLASIVAGNGKNHFEIRQVNVTTDATWHKLSAPYFVVDNPYIKAAITIEAGSVFKFGPDAGLSIESDGSLTANAAGGDVIEFSGDQAVSGYWRGLAFYSNNANNILDNVRISDGGSSRWVFMAAGGEANVAMDGGTRLTIQNSELSNSAGWGIWKDAGANLTQSGLTYSNNSTGNSGTDE